MPLRVVNPPFVRRRPSGHVARRMRKLRCRGVIVSGGAMDHHREEFRLLLGMAGIVLVTLVVLLLPLLIQLLANLRS
jgi:hypothetical protein